MRKFYKTQRKKVILSILLCCHYLLFKNTTNYLNFTESEKAKKHKEHLKQKLKNEERLANVTQIWTQEIIPNWHKM